MSFDKAWRKILKQLIFIALALLLSHVFLSYFCVASVVDRHGAKVARRASDRIRMGDRDRRGHLLQFLRGSANSFVIICPYGRLQSAMTDHDTMVIGCDVHRGEPRGKASDPNSGDCVGCKRCVVVCPTGIDIRNGLQLECIGCAACRRMRRDHDEARSRSGLVRYDSEMVLKANPDAIHGLDLFFTVRSWRSAGCGGILRFGARRLPGEYPSLRRGAVLVQDGEITEFATHPSRQQDVRREFSLKSVSDEGVEVVVPTPKLSRIAREHLRSDHCEESEPGERAPGNESACQNYCERFGTQKRNPDCRSEGGRTRDLVYGRRCAHER
ncbi:MAG: 4Fe-4S dicluster domain-containing protein [Polyangiales bacterium]